MEPNDKITVLYKLINARANTGQDIMPLINEITHYLNSDVTNQMTLIDKFDAYCELLTLLSEAIKLQKKQVF